MVWVFCQGHCKGDGDVGKTCIGGSKQVKKETTKKIFNIIWGIVWNHKEVILDKGLGFVKDIIKNAKVAKEVAGEMEKMLTDMIENGEVAVAG